MTKLSLKINRKYKKFSCNQHYCLVPVIGLTGLLIRQPKRFRSLLLVLRFKSLVPPRHRRPGSGRTMANWFCRAGTVTTLRPIIKSAGVEVTTRWAALQRDAGARAGAAAAAAPLPTPGY